MASVGIPDPFEDPKLVPPNGVISNRKSVDEIRQVVRLTRKMAISLLTQDPHCFTFRTVHTGLGTQTRLYFLGIPPGMRENTLVYVDIPHDQICATPHLDWKPLLEPFIATPADGNFSREEQLLRERKRVGSYGITSYDCDETSGKFVFPACSNLYMCIDNLVENSFANVPVYPVEIHTSCPGSRLDPKLCPNNADLLAYVSSNDIWVSNCISGHDKRLTFAHIGSSHLSEDPKSAGVPSFVVQEEFDRFTGYWWQPQLPTCYDGDFVYRILHEEVDESNVQILSIASPTEDGSEVDEYRYPRAGTANAKSTLKLLEFQLSESGAIINIITKRPYASLRSLFPAYEYIIRAGWLPNGQHVYVELMDRRQLELQLVLLPLACFMCCDGDNEDMVVNEGDYPDHRMQVLYTETSDVWVNVHDILHFLPQDCPNELSFIWSSEKSGYRHLHHITVSLKRPSEGDADMDLIEKQEDCNRARVLKKVILTSGEWEVDGKQIWVDKCRKLVYFIGYKDSPLETHLYVVSYDNPGTIIRLTEPGYSHTVTMDKQCRIFVSVYSRINKPPTSQVFKLIFTEDSVVPHDVGTLLSQATLSEEYRCPELFSYPNAEGQTMYGMVYKPNDLEPDKKYPTVLFVYGGPQVQLVTNAFKGLKFLRLQTLPSLGYAVVVMDSRGSCHRGADFEGYIKGRLGTVEIADQVEGLQRLASQVDFIDTSRVAIHGWSYGGYLSLMGLIQRPDIFKVAIAGAPVTSWMLYDTGYTERYMDLPYNNPDGYEAGSVIERAHKFPSQENRLLIIHGLIDENVHFYHTSSLINALVRACKPYQLQVYPNERHGIRNFDASEHYETMMLSFLQQHL